MEINSNTHCWLFFSPIFLPGIPRLSRNSPISSGGEWLLGPGPHLVMVVVVLESLRVAATLEGVPVPDYQTHDPQGKWNPQGDLEAVFGDSGFGHVIWAKHHVDVPRRVSTFSAGSPARVGWAQ